MKIEFDENKEYTLDELKEIQNDFWDFRTEINKRIKLKEIEDYDFSYKYVHSEEYGYMYVTWQHFDNKSIYGDERMFFQGLSFNSELGSYRDDSYLSYDALNEWYIPIETFKEHVKNGKFKEITKEEFMKVVNEHVNKLHNEIIEWVDYLEKECKNKEDEE